MTQPPGVERVLTDAALAAREGLRAALASGGLDAGDARALAERLSLNRAMAAQVARAASESDPVLCARGALSEATVSVLCQALARAGAPEDVLERALSAQRAFDRAVEEHAGDRGTLELILDALTAHQSAERLEGARRLAFRGECGLLGIQCRARTSTPIVMPSRTDPSRVDVAFLGTLVSVRRLRPIGSWPLAFFYTFDQAGAPVHLTGEEALDPEWTPAMGPKLVARFCSPWPANVRAVRRPEISVCELGEGPVGNTGATTVCFGTVTRAKFARYATPTDAHAQFAVSVSMPTELLQFDLLLHKDLGMHALPEASVHARVSGPAGTGSNVSIPVGERPRELSAGRLGSAALARYEEMLSFAAERLGVSLGDFRMWRFELAYPPMNSSAVLRVPLPPAPAGLPAPRSDGPGTGSGSGGGGGKPRARRLPPKG